MRAHIGLTMVLLATLAQPGCGKKSARTEKTANSTPAASMKAQASMSPMRVVAARQPPAPMRPSPPLSPVTPVPPKVKLSAQAEALAQMVEKALRSGSPDAVIALVADDDAIQGCPQLAAEMVKSDGSVAKSFANTKKQVRDAFKRCAALGSWAKAKRTASRQTAQKPHPVEGCKRLVEHGHIYLAYVIGGKAVTVKLSAPARVANKRWVLLDGVRCRLSGDVYR